MLQRNIDLLVLGVAWNTDNLHTVKQRLRHIHRVGSTNEHHVREIVINFKIVIVEGVVLFGVKHFKQCRRRVATVVHAHLVDFVEQEQRVFDRNLGELLKQLTRQSTDIGFPVATNFSFIAYATQRHTGVLAICRSRNGLPKRGFTDTRRPHQA